MCAVGWICLLLVYLYFFAEVEVGFYNTSRVSDQNVVSLLYIMLERHHTGREPSTLYPVNSFE